MSNTKRTPNPSRPTRPIPPPPPANPNPPAPKPTPPSVEANPPAPDPSQELHVLLVDLNRKTGTIVQQLNSIDMATTNLAKHAEPSHNALDLIASMLNDGLAERLQEQTEILKDLRQKLTQLVTIGENPPSAAPPPATSSRATPPPAPADTPAELPSACPKCGGPLFDNRAEKAAGTRPRNHPDFKCRDRECDWATWLDRKPKGARRTRTSAPEFDDGDDPRWADEEF